MSELPLNEELQRSLNLAFSINYMVLDNYRHVDLSNHQGSFTRDDIFGPKTAQQKTYDFLYKDYAEKRNECFKLLQDFFDSYEFEKYYIQNTSSLIDLYNKATNSNLKVSDVFSAKELKDVSYLERMAECLENSTFGNIKDRTSAYLCMQEFAIFYEKYKMWLSASEIFQTLKDDITYYGCKSFAFGKPSNEDIFLIDNDTYESFIGPVLKFVIAKEKSLEKERKQLSRKVKEGNTELEEDLEDVITKLIGIKLIYTSDSNIAERFRCANKKPDTKQKLNAILETIVSKFFFKETDFTVDNIYIHKYELFDLAQAMAIFPELEEQSKLLISIALGPIKDLSTLNPSQKENA